MLTMAELLAWEQQQAEGHDFFRGEILAIVGRAGRHNRIIGNLASRFVDHLDGTPCQIFAQGSESIGR